MTLFRRLARAGLMWTVGTLLALWEADRGALAQAPAKEGPALTVPPITVRFPPTCSYCIQMDRIGIRLKTDSFLELTREHLTQQGIFNGTPSLDAACSAGDGLGVEVDGDVVYLSEVFSWAPPRTGLERPSRLTRQVCQAVELWPMNRAAQWRDLVHSDRICLGSLVHLRSFLFVEPSDGKRIWGKMPKGRTQSSVSAIKQLPPHSVQNVCDGKLVTLEDALQRVLEQATVVATKAGVKQ